jgi:hypothetical protein
MSRDLDEAVAQLPISAPDAVRAGRTRRRCHALLERRSQWGDVASRIDIPRRALAAVIVGGFCVFFAVYVNALVVTTLHLQGMLHAASVP